MMTLLSLTLVRLYLKRYERHRIHRPIQGASRGHLCDSTAFLCEIGHTLEREVNLVRYIVGRLLCHCDDCKQ